MKNNKVSDFTLTRRGLLLTTGGVALSFAVGTISANAATGDTKIKVGFILPDFQQLRWKNGDLPGFKQTADQLGMNFISLQSDNSETVQANQVQDMLLHDVDVLVITPVNQTSASALVREANQAKVPVISYNYLISDADIACFVGNDWELASEAVASLAVKEKPQGNYILVLGPQGVSAATSEIKGFDKVLAPYIQSGAIKIVSRQFNAGWSTVSARAQVENALTKVNNDVAAVICGNDGTAYGAIQALRAQNLGGKVFVNGFDCEVRAQQLIQEGFLTASSFTDFFQCGSEAARAAFDLATGKSVDAAVTVNNGFKDVPWIKVKHVLVTKENLPDMIKEYPWWFSAAQS